MPNILTPDIREILEKCTFEGCLLKLPEGHLERPMYVKVNKHIENCGGKWSKQFQAHVFPSDPRPLIGLVLDTGKSVDEAKVKKKKLQAFYTPDSEAEMVAFLANVDGRRVLEPSAGGGALVRAAIKLGASMVECIEIDETAAVLLLDEGLRCVHADFLTQRPQNGLFERIVMNPPFSKGQYIKHISHAFIHWLKEDGILTAIVPDNGCEDMLRMGAITVLRFQAGTFKKAGTMIATRVIQLRK